jgi:hypothetical protein
MALAIGCAETEISEENMLGYTSCSGQVYAPTPMVLAGDIIPY